MRKRHFAMLPALAILGAGTKALAAVTFTFTGAFTGVQLVGPQANALLAALPATEYSLEVVLPDQPGTIWTPDSMTLTYAGVDYAMTSSSFLVASLIDGTSLALISGELAFPLAAIPGDETLSVGLSFNFGGPLDSAVFPPTDAASYLNAVQRSAAVYLSNPLGPPQFGSLASRNNFENPVTGVTIDGQFTTVPEPATWALAILGFGSAGAMLRRKRALVTAWSAKPA